MNNPLIVLCSGLSTFLPFLASTFIFKYTNTRSKTFLFLWIFFALAVVAEITMFVLGSLGKQSAWIVHVYTIIEYVIIASIFANWQTDMAIAKFVRVSILVYILIFVIAKAAGLENFSADTINYVTRPLAVFLLSVFAFLSLQALWSHTPENLTSDYRFWMLLAMVLYYSTSLVIFAFTFAKDRDLLLALVKIHAVVNILHNLLFTIGIFRVGGAKPTALQPTSAS